MWLWLDAHGGAVFVVALGVLLMLGASERRWRLR